MHQRVVTEFITPRMDLLKQVDAILENQLYVESEIRQSQDKNKQIWLGGDGAEKQGAS